MILLDVNVLVAAHRSDHSHHQVAFPWLTAALQGDEPVATWEVVLASCYRVLTHPKVIRDTHAERNALHFLTEIREASTVVAPGERYWSILSQLLVSSRAVGNLVTDAALAALALEHDCKLASFDQDFARFKGLRWFIPGE